MALINLIALLLSLRDLELLFNKSWDKVQRQTTRLQYGSNYLNGYGKLQVTQERICKKYVSNAFLSCHSALVVCVSTQLMTDPSL